MVKLLASLRDAPDPDGRILKGLFPDFHLPVGNQVFPRLFLLVVEQEFTYPGPIKMVRLILIIQALFFRLGAELHIDPVIFS